MAQDVAVWTAANQHFLVTALAGVRRALERHASGLDGQPIPQTPLPVEPWPAGLPAPVLETLVETFSLSRFERSLLLLCAGVELDGGFAGLCAAAQGDPALRYPTFGLSLAVLDDAHWSALAPDGPLRRWRLIEVVEQPPTPLTASPLRIDERVLHHLTGVPTSEPRLAGLIEPVPPDDEPVPSQRALADRVATAWSGSRDPWPLVQLCGEDEATRRVVTATACTAVGLDLRALGADLIPTNAAELDELLRLWEREAVFSGSALYVDGEVVDQADYRAVAAVNRFLERVNCPLVLGTRDRWRALRRRTLTFDVRPPTRDEQRGLWRAALGDAAGHLNGRVDHLVAQFQLGGTAIRASAAAALAADGASGALADRLWDAGRAQARARLDDLAQRIEPAAGWDDLVLPDRERRRLAEIVDQVAHRALVYDQWGFGRRGSRGLGISALFAGPSGTGKTLAAEVMASALRLDLYRIDLSSVVSKYIGETEKNLRRVFDAAEGGGAILFFDEADALFGKRSEVKDSHDRYANIEINYLLQRMESYRGLAILATNMKGTLDPAFLRRIRFVVSFPFPDAALRTEIWRRAFPPDAPTAGLDLGKLARLNLAGGNIRNVALNAAFLAAAAGEPVGMDHVLAAARQEYAKLEKPLTEAEIGGWP